MRSPLDLMDAGSIAVRAGSALMASMAVLARSSVGAGVAVNALSAGAEDWLFPERDCPPHAVVMSSALTATQDNTQRDTLFVEVFNELCIVFLFQ
ncbi:hypothetical protein GCM10025779_26000 [Arthrobacter cryoconiti]